MISISTITTILVLHFVGDFILQSNWMATHKSTNNKALLYHVLAYSSVFILISPLYAIINGIAHFGIDYMTSRITSKLWTDKEIHCFFIIIGLDQLLHTLILVGTYNLIIQ